MNKKIFILVIIALIVKSGFSQYTRSQMTGKDAPNVITTAVPFLLIAPESRGGAMGDAGVATSPDVNSMHYNPAKYAFIDKDMGLGISYTPWLRALVNDINLAYLTGYKRLDDKQVVAMELRYFSLGNITFTDIVGNVMRDFNPNEFAVGGTYSRLFGQKVSGAVSLRYIYSNLTGNMEVGGAASQAGQSIASDVSAYYKDDILVSGKNASYAIGANISNIGSKISYTENADKDFIPINFKFGSSFFVDLDAYNSIMLTAEINKLLVPTPPIYYSKGEVDANGDTINIGGETIKAGADPEVSVPVGMFRSFYDAPGLVGGSVFREELSELTYSVGAEYWYAKQFAIRAGYFHEDTYKGNRKFFTFGIGLKLNVFGLDFSYLIPINQHNPLENTLRFSLIFDFEGLAQQSEPTE